MDLIVSNTDRNKKVISIFQDLAKAFDTAFIPILIRKLELIDIRDGSLSLLEDYLTKRTQKSKIGDIISPEELRL